LKSAATAIALVALMAGCAVKSDPLARLARGAEGDLGAGGGQAARLLGAVGNTCNHGYIGSRATGSESGHYMRVGAGWKGATPPGIRKVFTSTTPLP
jgi:hypothetical protein